ncbi:hypothetical protein HMPREF1979_01645 [Actinomyces johnsonii F0542]|uniref:Uncharacterized protein n=1 Tax=Actinomyces johnsonii F0542 TaxID=1321818 RepID=U1RZJ5_9ACTO|nr:hypothetical protein HMPREF1979_01645 [Actinomyces johnsonii F0542]
MDVVVGGRPSGSGTAFSVRNVLLPQTTEAVLQLSAGKRSPRGKSTSPIRAGAARPRLVCWSLFRAGQRGTTARPGLQDWNKTYSSTIIRSPGAY